MIDIRSDTVTKPTQAMRKAMAEAEVGDDVYRDDPTVNELERLAASLVGKEAALFVPSGTFGNQLALFTWCKRGSEVILGEDCHIIQHEAGAASVIAGVQTRPIPAPTGRLNPQDIEKRIRGNDIHYPPTSLICMENAHSSGSVVPLHAMDEVYTVAQSHGIPVHLDGARIFNAAVSLGVEARELAARADSVMFCLSKGLCAPVGSLLAGPAAFIDQARKNRKIMGGGMRQTGILAAAGIVALRDMTGRLAEDHRRARRLAEGLSAIPGVQVAKDRMDINMVFFSIPALASPEKGQRFIELLKEAGILANPPEQGNFRFVTHYWIGDPEVQQIIDACKQALTLVQ
ncbi:low-specificity L-threonine aldolase [Gracilinema caldarium]|uniref:Threonine aldolase n=1 Tax=Gracilinema caldarium (strain ATCC 51460 / DSM 7334 / H1) TaxID=744872 RepID=F8F125_GRAC1|nr:low-specificity L-threonine aldolase [Gracilinema caldarium]AEJ20815.1 Threonine aldolase [Gracilinema caldarium DSM 7334]